MKNAVVLDIETTGLNPLDDRITAIGVIFKDEKKAFMDPEEKILLISFWDWLKKIPLPTIVGFNVYKFDIAFIHKRSMKHDINVPFSLKDAFLDLQYELNFYQQRCPGRLEDYALYLNIQGKSGSGKKAVILWEENRLVELESYCMDDVRVTFELFQRCLKAKVFPKECGFYNT